MSKTLAIPALIVFGLLGSSATAADLPIARSSSDFIPIVPHNWTGFYAGGNFGGEWSRTQFTSTAVASAAIPAAALPLISGLGTGMPLGNRLTGGLQAGFNWQFG